MRKNKGVSAVVGVILMVVITVAIAGVSYWYVSTHYNPPDGLSPVDNTTYSIYDLNKDGVVNQTDADILESNYGETGEPGWITSDINKDGIVDYLDVSALVSHMT